MDSVKPGDVVIPLYTAECGSCKFCSSKKTNLCSSVRATQGKGVMPDGTSRFTCKGKPLYVRPERAAPTERRNSLACQCARAFR